MDSLIDNSKLKKLRLGFLMLYLVNLGSLIILTLLCKKALESSSVPSGELFFMQQKQIALFNIIGFVVLLLASLVIYYLTTNQKPFWLINLTFIAVAAFNGFKLTPYFYTLASSTGNDQQGYLMITLFTVFYIAGAILVSAIGFITARNLVNRNIKH